MNGLKLILTNLQTTTLTGTLVAIRSMRLQCLLGLEKRKVTGQPLGRFKLTQVRTLPYVS